MNTFEAQGLNGNFEFEAFHGSEFEGANFGEAEFGEGEFGAGEFLGGEFEGEWEGETRDHRRLSPQAAVRVSDPRRPTVSRTGYRPTAWSSRSRSYAPQSSRWGARSSYGSRPVSRSWSSSWSRPWSGSSYRPSGQRYRWGQPGQSAQWYRSGQYPGRYWRSGQQGQSFPAVTPGWGGWGQGTWGRWRRRYPYGRYGYGRSAYSQPQYDEPTEPPYDEPPMPPPVIVAAPPQAPMGEPSAEPPTIDPNATTPPPAQGQAQSGEFFIEPEAFEFELEHDEYESGWGGEYENAQYEGPQYENPQYENPQYENPQYENPQYESSRGEYEGDYGEYEAPSRAAVCPPYQRGEVQQSGTAQGHLPSDVIRPSSGGLLIADFGVNQPNPKASLRNDPVLRSWLKENIEKARTNSSTKIFITGYSDCVGQEKDNGDLRQGRAELTARLIQQLAGPGARYLSGKVKPAPASPGSYLADNSTVQGRAQNRGVRIETKSVVTFGAEDVPARFPAPKPGVEEPEFIQRVIERGRALFGRTGKWDQFGMPIIEQRRRRILCLLDQIARPGADVRYLTALAVERYDQYLSIPEPELRNAIEYLIPVKRPWGVDPRQATPGGRKTDREIWRALSILEADIRAGIAMITERFETRQSGTSQRVQRLRAWVAKQMSNPLSIYLCFK
jgi:outer membrane protein OmpA-like peptidoglycan-associated protein